jgi:hypothetical protein
MLRARGGGGGLSRANTGTSFWRVSQRKSFGEFVLPNHRGLEREGKPSPHLMQPWLPHVCFSTHPSNMAAPGPGGSIDDSALERGGAAVHELKFRELRRVRHHPPLAPVCWAALLSGGKRFELQQGGGTPPGLPSCERSCLQPRLLEVSASCAP